MPRQLETYTIRRLEGSATMFLGPNIPLVSGKVGAILKQRVSHELPAGLIPNSRS